MLLLECGRSVSRASLPFVTLALETGARYNTIRTLQMRQHRLCESLPKVRQGQDSIGHGPDDPLESARNRDLEVLGAAVSHPATGAFRLSIGAVRPPRTEGTFGGTVQVYDHDPEKPVGTVQSARQSAKKRTQRHCLNCGDGTLIDRVKPAPGYECADCRFETPKLAAALTRLRFHDLRHSAVSRMIASRIPIPIIAKVVGWSPSTMAKMAARYGHFGIEELR